MNFHQFKVAVAQQFVNMQEFHLFKTDAHPDDLWKLYLDSFPENSNPIFRQRREYDCSACRHFIKRAGNIVAITPCNRLISIWDIDLPEEPIFQQVADKLSDFVTSAPIKNKFLHYERSIGIDRNPTYELDASNNPTYWEHFFINLPDVYCKQRASIGTLLDGFKSQHDVLKRSLQELTIDSVDTVLDLIAQNNLCRGEEHLADLNRFKELQTEFSSIDTEVEQDRFIWNLIGPVSGAVAHIRKSAIGSLLIDLSEGRDLEQAVRAYEVIVAPENYQRPKALVTPAMVKAAKEELQALGLESALHRRYATLDDINVNNVLFINRDVAKEKDVFDEISSEAPIKKLNGVEEVSIDKFLQDILPRVNSVEVLIGNDQLAHMVSLITAEDPTARQLFKWTNNFSWSYAGNMADSIKERVKRAKGNVTADLCCRLAWNNRDDLDLHLLEPNGFEIMFNQRRSPDTNGMLDVDMNAHMPYMTDAVENIFYSNQRQLQPGQYTLGVHNYTKRDTDNPGFTVEIDYLGEVTQIVYDKPVGNRELITVATFSYSPSIGIKILSSLPTSTDARDIWGIKTNTFRKVTSIMMSPNFWDGQVGIGNKHYFFMLEGCVNPDQARGFYNEFLHSDLRPHRKVFETVGAKLKVTQTDKQLSGIGFSSTNRNHLICRVSGKFTRTLKIMF